MMMIIINCHLFHKHLQTMFLNQSLTIFMIELIHDVGKMGIRSNIYVSLLYAQRKIDDINFPLPNSIPASHYN